MMNRMRRVCPPSLNRKRRVCPQGGGETKKTQGLSLILIKGDYVTEGTRLRDGDRMDEKDGT